jgi:nucleoside-diphosphate-sugar epimerase
VVTQDSIRESLCPAPINHYGMSKVAMEHMVRTWFDRLPIILTRPFNYTGPGQAPHFLVPKIVSHFQRRESTIELGNIAVSRDFLDVRDVAQIYWELLQSKVHAETINICSGQSVALQDIIAQMNKIAGYEINIQTNPALVRHNEIKCLVGDNTKLKKILTWTPTFSLEKTLRDMYEDLPM